MTASGRNQWYVAARKTYYAVICVMRLPCYGPHKSFCKRVFQWRCKSFQWRSYDDVVKGCLGLQWLKKRNIYVL